MAPCKGSKVFFLLAIGLLAVGLPVAGDSEQQAEGKSPSTAKDCRDHIEKALNQYWEQKEPSQGEREGKDQNQPIGDQLKHNDGTLSFDADNDDEDDDEEDDEDDDDVNNVEKNIDDDEEDEDEEDDDDDDEEEDDESEIVTRQKRNDRNGNEDDDDEDDDDDDDDEDDEVDLNENEVLKKSENISEADMDDDDDDEDDDEDEDEEDDDDELEENNGTVVSSNTTSQTVTPSNTVNPSNLMKDTLVVEVKTSNNPSNQSSNDDNDEDDDDDDDDEDDDGDDGDDDNDDDDDDDGEDDAANEDNVAVKVEIPTGRTSQTEKPKVTGEANSTSARVVSQLPEDKPVPQQPEAQKIEEKVPEEKLKKEDIAKPNPTTKPTDPDPLPEDDDDDDDDEDDDDDIENIYEDDDDDDDESSVSSASKTFRNRDHIDVILGLDEIGTEYDKEEEKLAQSIFRDIKKIQATNIRPVEMLYKYADSTSRVLGDAEIFNKPMLLFLGPWSAGKTTIINYLLGLERTPSALKTGTGVTDVDFTLVTYGDQRQVVSGTELAASWKYAGVQRFGQGFLDHFRSVALPHTLLKQITIVDTPGILENKKNTERGYSFNDAFQWFIDRADAIYVVLDPTKVDIGGELGSVVDQLKGREVRFILNKADTIRRSDLMRVVGQLFWNLSPLMSSTEAPVIYAASLATKPYHPNAPAKFLADQEKNFLYDMRDTFDKRVENRILYARRHAVRVRNHAKMVDCYLSTYYSHKSIFSSKKNVAKLIVENPREYNIFEGLGRMTNVSRYDLPDPVVYKDFFKSHPLYDFKPLASTCSYFRGCPMEKLDSAIANELPELFTKYKKAKSSGPPPTTTKQQGR